MGRNLEMSESLLAYAASKEHVLMLEGAPQSGISCASAGGWAGDRLGGRVSGRVASGLVDEWIGGRVDLRVGEWMDERVVV